jgi:hypothetical protein
MTTQTCHQVIDRRNSEWTSRLSAAALGCLRGMMEAFHLPDSCTPVAEPGRSTLPLPDQVFGALTSRQFSHMGRTQSQPYREDALKKIDGDISSGRPVHFFFDLGPGYHACLLPREGGLRFDVGLGEFLALRQVHLFGREVRRIYSQGVRFFLVIDNLCGLFTNDIPLENSSSYVRQLRMLINQLALEDTVEVLAESEAFTVADYDTVLRGIADEGSFTEPSGEDVENVARFLGRPCGPDEAAERIRLYRRTGMATERLLSKVVHGVRLTQRATASTLGFRSFPGGAQRIQAGEIVVAVDESERTRPILLTSRNLWNCDIRTLEVDGILPPAIPQIRYARLLPHADRRHRRKV